jgi:hypothetical protein
MVVFQFMLMTEFLGCLMAGWFADFGVCWLGFAGNLKTC